MKKLIYIISVMSAQMMMTACTSLDLDNEALSKPMIGHYVLGHEVNTFQPCRDEKVYWVDAEQKLLNKLEEHYYQISKTPYEAVFIEMNAEYVAVGNDGFEADFDGKISVSNLLLMREKSEKDCQ